MNNNNQKTPMISRFGGIMDKESQFLESILLKQMVKHKIKR
jgi:hypothetical protein